MSPPLACILNEHVFFWDEDVCRSKYGLRSGFSSSTFFRAKSLILHVSQPWPKQYQQCNSKFVVRADAVSTHHDLLA